MIYLNEQMERHPATEAQDIVKMCYQAAFSAEHLISDKEKARKHFCEEFEETDESSEPLFEMISDRVSRINIGAWKREKIPSDWLFSIFLLSVSVNGDGRDKFEKYISEAAERVPNIKEYLSEYLKDGIHPIHHSESYRHAESPHYRIADNRFIRLLPILSAASHKTGIIAIDGRAASGKTTMTNNLCRILNASAVHMDDFFLPPQLRTDERLNAAGGNIHYERFFKEVIPNLKSGKDFSYTVFDCSKMDYGEKRTVSAAPYIIVEGAYSCHPAFGDYAHIKVFSDISPEEQIKRILLRNGEKAAEMFVHRWIPMEEKYYEEYQIKENADLAV